MNLDDAKRIQKKLEDRGIEAVIIEIQRCALVYALGMTRFELTVIVYDERFMLKHSHLGPSTDMHDTLDDALDELREQARCHIEDTKQTLASIEPNDEEESNR